MSSIATFHVLADSLRGELVAAAQGQVRQVERRFLFLRWHVPQRHDGYWDFLRQQATEGEKFEYSGYGFSDLDLMLEELFDELAVRELSDVLSKARQAFVTAYDQPSAQRLISSLGSAALTDTSVRKFLSEEGRDPDDGAPVLLAAAEQAKRWLSQVGSGQLGLLNVG